MENEIIEVQPTTSELIDSKSSRLIDIKSELKQGDYKHTRQIREERIKCTLTMSEADYAKFCESQRLLTEEYNVLENEIKLLKIKLAEEVININPE